MSGTRENLLERIRKLGAEDRNGDGTTTILVVDDNATSRLSLTRTLGYAEHRTLEASNGIDALSIVRSEHPDVILADVIMPQMDGYELAQHVRADPSLEPNLMILSVEESGHRLKPQTHDGIQYEKNTNR